MKRKLVFGVASIGLATVMGLTGCSGDGSDTEKDESKAAQETEVEAEETSSTDQELIEAINQSTQARWETVKLEEERFKTENRELTKDENYNHLTQLIKAETDVLSSYMDNGFTSKNKELEKVANEYLDGLKKQEKSLEHYYGNIEKSLELWDEGYG